MAKVKLIGYKIMDFIAKDKSEVKGVKVFISHLDDETIGEMTEDFFIKNPAIITIKLSDFIGKSIEVDLGFKGKVQCISAV